MNVKGGLIFFILSGFCLPGFFVAQNCLASGEVVINEAAWAGSIESSYDEWLELKNNSAVEVNLAGWKLEATDGSPKISLAGVILAGGYFLLERTNDGSSPAAADQFYSGSLDNDGEYLELKNESGEMVDFIDFSAGWAGGDNITKTTIQRCPDAWFSSAAPLGTPKADNSCFPSGTEIIPPQEEGENTGPVFRFGDFLINEFYSNPADGETEWVEIYNPSGSILELENWYLSDGSGAKTFLNGGFEDGEKFFLLGKPKGALNNSGDEIGLFSPDGNLIDRVVYGDWGSSTAKNAPAPSKGFSAGRREDGFKNGGLDQVFLLTSVPTPGSANKIILTSASSTSTEDQSAEDVLITEVFPNPLGSDASGEFIEFYNQGDEEVDLSGWRVAIRSGKQLEFGHNFLAAPILKPKTFFALFRPESRAALDNNGGRLELFKPSRKTAVQILDYPSAAEGESFSDTRIIDKDKISSSTKNFLINALSVARWTWTKTSSPGRPNEIKVENRPPQINFSLVEDDLATGTPVVFDASDSVDEDGDQLYFRWNFGDGTIVEKESVGHVFLKSGEYQVRLEVGDGKDKSFLEKKVVIPPFALLPVKEKIFEQSVNKDAIKITAVAGDKFFSSASPSIFIASISETAKSDLRLFSSLKTGALAQVQGQVLVEPGMFGKQYFYIIASASPALKIYNYYSEFPKLQEGDNILAKGEAAGGGEKYLKIRSLEDVQKISSGSLPPAEKINEALSSDDEGRFIEMAGVIKKSNSQVFLSSSAGETRIFLKNPTNLSPSDFTAGQNVRISGLVISISSGQALAPRGAKDLFFDSAEPEGGLPSAASSSSVASAPAEGREWILPAASGQNKVLAYTLVLALAGLLVLGGVLFKEKLVNKR